MLRTILPASLAILLVACSGTGAPSAATRAAASQSSGVANAPDPSASSIGTDATTAAAIDACRILRDDDIVAATGHAVEKRQPSSLTQVFPSVCDVSLDKGGSFTLSILSSGGRQLWERSFEPLIGKGALDEAVPGLGDKAGRTGQDELMVLKGDVLFDVLYVEYLRKDKLTVVRALADRVLARLP